jgi:hypothetical protein
VALSSSPSTLARRELTTTSRGHQVLLALGRCHGDIMIANEAVETIETISKIPECVDMTAQASTPLVMSVLQNPEKFVGTMVESVLELLSKIIRKGAPSLPSNTPYISFVLAFLCRPPLRSPLLELTKINSCRSRDRSVQRCSSRHGAADPFICYAQQHNRGSSTARLRLPEVIKSPPPPPSSSS